MSCRAHEPGMSLIKAVWMWLDGWNSTIFPNHSMLNISWSYIFIHQSLMFLSLLTNERKMDEDIQFWMSENLGTEGSATWAGHVFLNDLGRGLPGNIQDPRYHSGRVFQFSGPEVLEIYQGYPCLYWSVLCFWGWNFGLCACMYPDPPNPAVFTCCSPCHDGHSHAVALNKWCPEFFTLLYTICLPFWGLCLLLASFSQASICRLLFFVTESDLPFIYLGHGPLVSCVKCKLFSSLLLFGCLLLLCCCVRSFFTWSSPFVLLFPYLLGFGSFWNFRLLDE